jgi:hypothetical protein
VFCLYAIITSIQWICDYILDALRSPKEQDNDHRSSLSAAAVAMGDSGLYRTTVCNLQEGRQSNEQESDTEDRPSSAITVKGITETSQSNFQRLQVDMLSMRHGQGLAEESQQIPNLNTKTMSWTLISAD